MSQAAAVAAVIDLDAFRRERNKTVERARTARRPSAPAVCVLPVVVAWVPVWPVA